MTRPTPPSCPLCGNLPAVPSTSAHGRRYHACRTCGLAFMHPDDRPGPREERARYETHENNPADVRYRAFLSRLSEPLVRRLSPGSRGLDYGSGPGPTLSVMLREAGFEMEIYDPYFAPDTEVFRDRFDFVTCTETVEHFFRPAVEFERIDGLLERGGWLGVMTERLDSGVDLATWHYARDPTHVCFYPRRTMLWIGRAFGWVPEFPDRNVTLFRKS